MRAAIRSNVLFTKSRLAPDHDNGKEAQAYFDLALRLITPAQPSLVAIGGKSGTGKSLLARAVAALLPPMPGAILLRSDVIRKPLLGYDPLASLPGTAYTPDVTERVYQLLVERSREIVGQGFSAVVDAAFLKRSERDDLSEVAKKLTVDFRPVFLDADLAVRVDRIKARKNDASDATPEVAAAQEDYETGKIDWPIIDASGSPEQTLARSRPVLVPV
jgi:predicted kinase